VDPASAAERASRSAVEALEWAETIADEPLRQTVLAAELGAWPETESTTLTAGRLLGDTPVSIVQRWSRTDAPAAATSWQPGS
jgi:hypothetical protein